MALSAWFVVLPDGHPSKPRMAAVSAIVIDAVRLAGGLFILCLVYGVSIR